MFVTESKAFHNKKMKNRKFVKPEENWFTKRQYGITKSEAQKVRLAKFGKFKHVEIINSE